MKLRSSGALWPSYMRQVAPVPPASSMLQPAATKGARLVSWALVNPEMPLPLPAPTPCARPLLLVFQKLPVAVPTLLPTRPPTAPALELAVPVA